MASLGIHSHRDLDSSLFPYPERRKRDEGKRLAHPDQIKSFGQALVIYPGFGLAGLIVDRPTASEQKLLRHVDDAAKALYATAAFREFAHLAAGRLRPDWTMDSLISEVAEADPDVLIELGAEVLMAESRLEERGVLVERFVGLLRDVTESVFLIVADDEAVESRPVNAAVSRLEPGRWVVRDLITLGSRTGEIVVSTVPPTLLPEALVEVGAKTAAEDRASATKEVMVSPTRGQVVSMSSKIPILYDDEDDSKAQDGVLSVPVDPGRRVQLDLSGVALANSMVRASHSTIR